MHVHMKPTLVPQAPVPRPPTPAKAAAAPEGSDVDALLALSRDRRGGAGSRQRQPPARQDERDGKDEDAPARLQPAASLSVLLTELQLDRGA